MKVLRTILAVVLGVGLAFVVVIFAEEAVYKIFPVPTDIDWSDAAAVRRYTGSRPIGASLALLAAWVCATLIGAVIGSAIARPRAVFISIIVGGLMLAATGVNFLMSPHPLWLVMAAIIGIVAATWLAAKLMWKPAGPPTSR